MGACTLSQPLNELFKPLHALLQTLYELLQPCLDDFAAPIWDIVPTTHVLLHVMLQIISKEKENDKDITTKGKIETESKIKKIRGKN